MRPISPASATSSRRSHAAGARVFHFDIGDGHFIPEITVGPIVLASISPLVHGWGGVLDCHLMVSEPERHFEAVAKAGGDSVTFHVEACDDPRRAIARARELGLSVGVACNPDTPVEDLAAAAEGADLALCMSIEPGYSGQEFRPDALARIEQLATAPARRGAGAGRRWGQRRRRSLPRGTPAPICSSPGARSSGATTLRTDTRSSLPRSRNTHVADGLRESAVWRRLASHYAEIRDLQLRDLFESDPGRGERMTLEAGGLYLDYSKHRVTSDTLQLLRELAAERGFEERTQAMFRGEAVNVSEGRSALHVALRMPSSRSLIVGGVDVVKEVHEELDRLTAFTEAVRSGEWVGATGSRIRAVVNIGIGGSDLGPAMTCEALRPYATKEIQVRFVSNVDPADLEEAVRHLDPAETLFVVVSKTMSTLETMANARAAREWAAAALGDEGAQRHFAGVAANAEAGAKVGIPPERVFRLWDWVGGRTSLCSAVGLSVVIAVGSEKFRELLAGFHAVDEHFSNAPLDENLPALCGLLSFWYRNFFEAQSTAVFPYSHQLRLLPAYLQQLWMESNGKRVAATGEPIEVDTGSVLWGGEGTNAQHAVFQLLHQGTVLCPADLIGFARPSEAPGDRHDLLAANLFAQSEALAFGRTAEELEDAGVPPQAIPHRVMPGNRPTSVILAEQLTPASLGALVALYEHSVFTQAAIWGIDPFDQWGVELGKELAAKIAPELEPGSAGELQHDSSTNALIGRYKTLRASSDDDT